MTSDETRTNPPDRPVYTKLKDIRECFSLSEGGFRVWEREGLVHPARNEANDYRVSPLSDGVRMCCAYDLTRLGMTLRQTREVLDGSLENQIDAYDRFNAEISRNLQQIIARKAHLERWIWALKDYERNPRACRVTATADIWCQRMHSHDMHVYRDSFDELRAWWQAAPLVDGCLAVRLGEDRGAVSADHGPCADRDVVLSQSLPTTYALNICKPGTEYLHAYVASPSEELPPANVYTHIFAYLDEHGRTMQKNVKFLHRLLRHYSEEGIPTRLDEVFIPLDPLPNP